jgi:glutaredoxin
MFLPNGTADFYKWVDEKGQTRITDYPPPQEQAAKNIEIHKSESPEPPPQAQDDSSKVQEKKKSNVVLYTKNDCKDCDKARDFLKSKNIDFTEYNMDTDETAAAKRKEIDDGDEVPLAVINRNRVHGFSESVYDRVLKMEP